ncbi:hypothetical protein ER308_03870 [Egibacter rhizosphaerae]|uniref:Uncharacterized protein n=1 Tax=Egibacter rhizosphaerae TaxID=1670831 RepID=A0A411YC11_9ACTN|nr:hypothetical protein [Egibacter rhizosphaerae]QBI18771.1 hypothetical protein ER308_03870 [Egibacter rhizosphaerae]
MADPSVGERELDGERARGQRGSALGRLWERQFATNRPPGPLGYAPVLVFLSGLLVLAAGIGGLATDGLRSALGFVLLAFGLVLATLMNMVRDEFVRWVVPINLLALVVMVVGIAVYWTS